MACFHTLKDPRSNQLSSKTLGVSTPRLIHQGVATPTLRGRGRGFAHHLFVRWQKLLQSVRIWEVTHFSGHWNWLSSFYVGQVICSKTERLWWDLQVWGVRLEKRVRVGGVRDPAGKQERWRSPSGLRDRWGGRWKKAQKQQFPQREDSKNIKRDREPAESRLGKSKVNGICCSVF